jgi:hypothetical protein
MRGSFGTDLRRLNGNFLGSYGPAMRPRGSAGRRRIDNLGSASLDASHSRSALGAVIFIIKAAAYASIILPFQVCDLRNRFAAAFVPC